MAITLSQKERMLLQDEKHHEQMCVNKYTKYANEAQAQQLKQLFSSYAAAEQQHLNTINQILNGQVPNMAQQGQQTNQSSSAMQQNFQSGMQVQQNKQGAAFNKNDAELCNDMLATEKYISGTYDTAIFECADTNVRNALNHIQKEEQEHGEGLFNYMRNNGMYNVQQ